MLGGCKPAWLSDAMPTPTAGPSSWYYRPAESLNFYKTKRTIRNRNPRVGNRALRGRKKPVFTGRGGHFRRQFFGYSKGSGRGSDRQRRGHPSGPNRIARTPPSMKVRCPREPLLAALQSAAAVVPARSPKPVLTNVKLEAGREGTVISATSKNYCDTVSAQQFRAAERGTFEGELAAVVAERRLHPAGRLLRPRAGRQRRLPDVRRRAGTVFAHPRRPRPRWHGPRPPPQVGRASASVAAFF